MWYFMDTWCNKCFRGSFHGLLYIPCRVLLHIERSHGIAKIGNSVCYLGNSFHFVVAPSLKVFVVRIFSGEVLGWGLPSQFSLFRYFRNFSALSKHTLNIKYHVYIWQVSAQLSCGDTCQTWMWLKKSNSYFCKTENFAYGEINERSFSNPHPKSICFFHPSSFLHVVGLAFLVPFVLVKRHQTFITNKPLWCILWIHR